MFVVDFHLLGRHYVMAMKASKYRDRLIRISDWVIPPNIFKFLTTYHPGAVKFRITNSQLLRENRQLKGCHQGKRCFILCNGPSVASQDIAALAGEVIFSVSNGYHHADYSLFRPAYHCIPQITYGTMTEEDVILWFREMEATIGSATLILNYSEYNLVRKYNLFTKNKVHYVCMGRYYFPSTPRAPDISKIIPRVQSVPILVLMICMYMGFKEIYLLGTEHDWFVKKEYKYFFEPTILKGKDFNVNLDGTLKHGIYDELPSAVKLWKNYRAIRLIAEKLGVNIYNATPCGLLDEFERIDFCSILAERSATHPIGLS